MQVINGIVDNTHALCENCGLSANHIADGAFQCFRQGAHEVTFRAHLYATPTSTPQELVNYIINWVRRGVSIVINGLLLTIDGSCDVIIESFSVPECTQEQQHTSEPAAMTTTNHIFKSITTPKHDTTRPISQQPTVVTNTWNFSAQVIVVGAVVVMGIFIVAVMLTVIIVVCLCTKYCRLIRSVLDSIILVTAWMWLPVLFPVSLDLVTIPNFLDVLTQQSCFQLGQFLIII